MEILKPALKEIISNSSSGKLFKMNLAKEYLQIPVLNFIYSSSKYSKLVFYGGSCLVHCFNLPRLSEDLDFVDEKGEVDIRELANDIGDYFNKNTDLNLKTTVQNFRIYLKFPILRELGISKNNLSETDDLFLKIEVFSDFNFCNEYKTEIRPIFKFNKSILVKTFSLETLMSTKIRAIFFRKWEKTDKKGNVLVKAKGRDYFDLMWYLEKGIVPNLKCIENIKNMKDLRDILLKSVSKVDKESIRLDLEAFIDDGRLVNNLSDNLKDILIREIKEKLI